MPLSSKVLFEPRRRSRHRHIVPLCATLVGLVAACAGEYPQSTLHPTSDFAVQLDGLYRTIFWWAVGVFVVVESVLVVTILRFRERPGAPEPKHVHGSTLLEMAWTFAPVVVLVFIAVPTIQTIAATTGEPDEGDLEIDVVGHQWWWEYRYPEYGITTANEMHVPVGRRVALRMTSADVIHSFWAPKLSGKRDVLPRRTTHLAFTPDSVGEVMGQCAEFCGESHANMRLRVFVDDSAAFAAWVAREQAAAAPDTLDPLIRRGLDAFRQVRTPASNSCIACHAVQGVSAGVLGPNLSHVGSRSTIAAGMLPGTAEGLARWLRDPPAEKPGSLMPRIDLTDDEIAALVAYLMSLR
jgi:cytochrome c oxidase subunit 2